ncbi:MAG: type II toxin-antitoxin system PemK/MazF family toxin [Bacilli bacterium]|nr:type II toxin-antitoxin system PemK/MazF family toxin [Bacilli bacterium]
MLTINWKQVYQTNDMWVLILYDISKNHYVGVPVYSKKQKNSIYLKSIKRYIVLDEIVDYNYSSIKKAVYINGKKLVITNDEFKEVLLKAKDTFLNYVKSNTDNTPNGIAYNKWCKDKLDLINKETHTIELKVGAVCWVDLGYNIGNELRKLRPAILWRSSSDKKMWTVIPITSKRKNDKYYFHYDLITESLGTARIENLINISSSRIKAPYYKKDKVAKITKKDNDEILKTIKRYYAFENVNTKKVPNKKLISKRSKVKENRETVLT